MIFQDVWFAKLPSRKGWANRLVDLVAVAALTFIEVDQLEVAGCGDFGASAESLIHDDDSWWLLMVPDVAFPGPKDIGSQCCLVSNRGPHHFPRLSLNWFTIFLVGWENLQETPMFHGKIPGFRDVSADFCQHQFIDQPGTVSIATSEFVFFQGDSGESWPPLDAGGTGSML